MDIVPAIVSQYLAALEMLRQAVVKCPDSLWDDVADRTKFWHVAYHILFYTHFYLQDAEETFTPWSKYREGYHRFDPPKAGNGVVAYDKQSVLEYLDFCRAQVRERLQVLDLDAPSGFYWLPFNKLELQLYTIRHIQQHTGELMERLGTRAGLELDWIGTQHD